MQRKPLDTLSLWIHSSNFAKDDDDTDLFNNTLIKKALKMGATCLDLKTEHSVKAFTLPHEVFESENLTTLSIMSWCKIDDGKVNCSKLKSLTLDRVFVEDGFIRDIISNCPLLENFSLSQFRGAARKLDVGLLVDNPFSKLKCLLLSRVDVDSLFFDNFSSRFPYLKDLTLDHCDGYKGVNLASPSLECVSVLTSQMLLRAKFDVPSIRKFTFSGTIIPSLSFKTTTSNWESNISIKSCRSPTANWILKLNKLLTQLSLSKISLTLSLLPCPQGRFDNAEHIQGLPKHKVENLTINQWEIYCSSLFDGLFLCCRPIYVNQYVQYRISSLHRIKNIQFMKLVYKRMMRQVGLKGQSANQSMSGEIGLVGVDVEFFDETVSAWRPRLSDASTSPGADEQRIRLHLRWGR